MSETSDPIRPAPPPDFPRSRRLLLAGLILAMSAGVWVGLKAVYPGRAQPASTPYRNARPGVAYVGDAACARCHQEIARTYREHPMGRSLTTVDAAPAEVRGTADVRELFEAQGYHYAVERRGERTFHIETRRNAHGQVVGRAEGEVRFVLGSGTRGASFLVDHDGYLFESPITWYPQERRWDLSPGYKTQNAHFERPISVGCLTCHSHQVEHVAGTDNRYRPPVFRGHAIGCERCHGPGALHVRDPVGNFNIVNPRALEPALRESVCQQCHLIGVKNVERFGRTLADYRPGLPLYWFESVLVRPAATEHDHRNSGHVEQMSQSRCFRASQGALGCISCHDPHKLPAANDKVDYYRDRCLKCHSDRGCTLPPAERLARSADDSCIACHMPRASTSDVPHLATTIHSIPRHGEAVASSSLTDDSVRHDDTTLVLFHRDLMSAAERAEGNRDVGVALSTMGRNGAARALPLLERALEAHPDDVSAWEATGYALAALGRRLEGLAAFESGLRLDPNRESLTLGAGFCADQAGRRAPAIRYFERAIALDPWRSDYFAALALPLLESDRWDEAAAAARRALTLNPANQQARVVLIRCLHHAGDAAQVRTEFDVLLAFDPPDREGLLRWFATLK